MKLYKRCLTLFLKTSNFKDIFMKTKICVPEFPEEITPEQKKRRKTNQNQLRAKGQIKETAQNCQYRNS